MQYLNKIISFNLIYNLGYNVSDKSSFLDIGTHAGCSSFFMSLAIKNSMKNSEVISVEKVKEIFDHNFKFRSQIIRFQNDTDDIIKFLNLDGRNFELKKYINFPLRFVLVDGDSSIDFYMDVFYNLLEEDSYVIFDDCTPSINRFTIQNCFIDKKHILNLIKKI